MQSRQLLPRFELIAVGNDELPLANKVIASAIATWPISERLKSNVQPILFYDALDLTDMQIIMSLHNGEATGVAPWTGKPWLDDPDGQGSGLLHGLYVSQDWQRYGIGTLMQLAVATSVMAAGGHGIHVRAERFAAPYFARSGYRRLAETELISATGSYEHRYWSSCADILDLDQPVCLEYEYRGNTLSISAEG